jgi:hypothetical protein
MLPDHDVTIVERAITLDQVKEYHLEETASLPSGRMRMAG